MASLSISAQSLCLETAQYRSSHTVGAFIPWGNYCAACETVHRPSAGLCPSFSYLTPSTFSISVMMGHLSSTSYKSRSILLPGRVAFWPTTALSSIFPCLLLRQDLCSCSPLPSEETTPGITIGLLSTTSGKHWTLINVCLSTQKK